MKRHITTPIYYASGAPHLGHAYTTLLADIHRRYCVCRGIDAVLTSGTDEHGQKVEQSATASGQDLTEFLAARSEEYSKLWARLDIRCDHFVRTTSPEHAANVARFWERLKRSGDIYLGDYRGWYCIECEQYQPPATDAEPSCPIHGGALDFREEPSYFFALSRYQEALHQAIAGGACRVHPATRRNEVLARLEGEPLHDLSVSRTSTDWGIPVPGDPAHVIYVWVDALISYTTALGGIESPRFADYWPDTVHFIGRDILVFHALYWPALLLSAGLPLPRDVVANGWLTVEGRKIAKSDPQTVIDPGHEARIFGRDSLRSYLARASHDGRDTDFQRGLLTQHHNKELLGTLGNLVQRYTGLVARLETRSLEPDRQPTDAVRELHESVSGAADKVAARLHAFDTSGAVHALLDGYASINRFIQHSAPWERIGSSADSRAVHGELCATGEAILHLNDWAAVLLPDTASEIGRLIVTDDDRLSVKKGTHLFVTVPPG